LGKWNKKVQTRLPTPGTGGQDTMGYQIIRSSETVQKHEGNLYSYFGTAAQKGLFSA
jgi:hypothetical protein